MAGYTNASQRNVARLQPQPAIRLTVRFIVNHVRVLSPRKCNLATTGSHCMVLKRGVEIHCMRKRLSMIERNVGWTEDVMNHGTVKE